MTQVQQSFAAINGANIYYEISGQGEPLVLIHSLLLHSGMWDDQVTGFADKYTVLRFDLSGHGKSQPVTASDADDLNALMAHVGIASAHVLGLSVGAEVALGFALKYPQRVRSLILVSSGVDGFEYSEEDQQNFQKFLTPVQARDFVTARDVFMRQVIDGPISPAAPHVRARARQMMDTYTFANFFPPEETAATPEQEVASEPPADPPKPMIERLGEIKVPTLVIVGDRDTRDMASTASVLAEGITGAKRVMVHDAAHIVNLEQPEIFNQTVIAFLSSVK